MTATTKPVDVLAVLDEIDIVFDIGADKEKRDSLRNVRAVIAELIAADVELDAAKERRAAALAAIQGENGGKDE